MCKAIPPTPNMPSCRGAELQHIKMKYINTYVFYYPMLLMIMMAMMMMMMIIIIIIIIMTVLLVMITTCRIHLQFKVGYETPPNIILINQ
jgi:hypothetical protein